MSTQALSVPSSSLSLLFLQTQVARWKAATPEQLTGAHLYLDKAKSGYLFQAVGDVMEFTGVTHLITFHSYTENSQLYPVLTNRESIPTVTCCVSCNSILTICNYKTESNEIYSYGRVSRGSPRESVGRVCFIYRQSNMTIIKYTTGWALSVRKSKDFVYGIWVYKVLGKWKGYYRVKKSSLVSCMKPWNEARNSKYMKYHFKRTYQLAFWNVSRNVDYHAGGKWFIHGPKRRKENQLLSLKHPCWFSLV